MKRTPIRRVNKERRAKRFERDYGGKAYLEAIHGMPCAVCNAPCELTEAAHLTSRGAGGTAKDVAPLCGTRHGTQGCHQRYDLHDPEIRKHEPRLRALARRLWSEWQTRGEQE